MRLRSVSYSTPYSSVSAADSLYSRFVYLQNFLTCPPSSRFFFLGRCDPTRVIDSSFLRFIDHTQRRTTVGRTPLDKWSARHRDLYLTTHNTHNRQTSMSLVRFEPTISVGERPQTFALDGPSRILQAVKVKVTWGSNIQIASSSGSTAKRVKVTWGSNIQTASSSGSTAKRVKVTWGSNIQTASSSGSTAKRVNAQTSKKQFN